MLYEVRGRWQVAGSAVCCLLQSGARWANLVYYVIVLPKQIRERKSPPKVEYVASPVKHCARADETWPKTFASFVIESRFEIPTVSLTLVTKQPTIFESSKWIKISPCFCQYHSIVSYIVMRMRNRYNLPLYWLSQTSEKRCGHAGGLAVSPPPAWPAWWHRLIWSKHTCRRRWLKREWLKHRVK